MSPVGLAIPAILALLFTLLVTFACFVLAGFVARRFEKTSSGILIGGLAGLGALIVTSIILSTLMSAVFYSLGANY